MINVVEGGCLVEVCFDFYYFIGQVVCCKGKVVFEMLVVNNWIFYLMCCIIFKIDLDFGWECFSWDQVLDIVVVRLIQICDMYGFEVVGFLVIIKSGMVIVDGIEWVDCFICVFGSFNVIGVIEICNWYKDSVYKFIFGCVMLMLDYENVGLILFWGYNFISIWLLQVDVIGWGCVNGVQMIVVDLCFMVLVQVVDLWLCVCFGIDVVLVMGLLCLLIGIGQVKWDFVIGWINVFLLVCGDMGCFLCVVDLLGYDDLCFVVWDRVQYVFVLYDICYVLLKFVDFVLDGCMEVMFVDGCSVVCCLVFDLFCVNCVEWMFEWVEQVCGVFVLDLCCVVDLLVVYGFVVYYVWNGVG